MREEQVQVDTWGEESVVGLLCQEWCEEDWRVPVYQEGEGFLGRVRFECVGKIQF